MSSGTISSSLPLPVAVSCDPPQANEATEGNSLNVSGPETAADSSPPTATQTATTTDVASFPLAAADVAPTPLSKVDDAGKPFNDRHFNGDLIGANGEVYDSKLGIGHVPPIEPKQGRTSDQPVVFIPGINTNVASAADYAQILADKTGRPVVVIHDATFSNTKATPLGVVEDLGTCLLDKADIPGDKAVETATNEIVSALKSGQPLELNFYSKGAIIGGDALMNAKNRLMVEEGWSKSQVEGAMNKLLTVNTEGGAERFFPNGPRYYHEVNTGVGVGPLRVGADPVANLLGVGPKGKLGHGGARAVVDDVHFLKRGANPFGGHDFARYMQHYDPHYKDQNP